MSWLFLLIAIAFEVCGTMSLRLASAGQRWLYLAVAAGYVLSYVCLSQSLSHGMGLGVAYGIWTAVGVAATAILGKVLFKEPLTWVMSLGIVLIMIGVVVVEVGAAH
ncbi:DMT family transporter [Corynebacterium tapiri]|uniref:Multidrug efflux SMR transporter n=1 Tax=Corynebacterium tapiri TaxID=1448266 RepID=A0A5C4U4H9_9CORY|nr:multidrug efflux SMR transporter [Corynebacterium tapiri]TNL96776.1 multidrug efflux SMR transporter [Corynebacterium tapiri]